MPHDATIDLMPIKQYGLDLDQYFGLWVVAEDQFLAMFDRVSQLNLAAHVQVNGGQKLEAAATRPVTNARTSEVTIGIVDINGTLMKRGTSLSNSSSLVNIRRVIGTAARDPEIDAILLRIDSPGGTLAGTQEVADAVRQARESKPVFALVEDLAASAAYWIASQAERVYANTPTALTGSVGTFVGLYDYSVAAAKAGVKAVVIRAGEMKGAGFIGTEITDEQKAYWQEIVNKAQTEFTAAVASGRNKSVQEVAERYVTGRVYLAADAVAMGMIDGVKSFDQVIAELTTRVQGGRRPSNRSPKMSDTQETAASKAATIQELKAACVGSDADFIVSQLETSATVAQAQQAWAVEQQRRLEAAEKAAAEAQAKAAEAEAKANAPGVDALGAGETKADEAADPVAAWNEAVAAKVAAGLPQAKAVAAVVHENPELHQAYLEAANAH